MKLGFSPNSPYVRKVRICALRRGIVDAFATLAERGEWLTGYNPLGKVPTLVLPDGTALFDSPVICEFLDTLGDAPPLFPPSGPSRWTALRRQALGDGMMDASQPRRRELALPQDEGRQAYIADLRGKVTASVDALEREAGTLDGLATIGEITIACALAYLDFRFPHEPWRDGHPALATWFAGISNAPEMRRSAPTG